MLSIDTKTNIWFLYSILKIKNIYLKSLVIWHPMTSSWRLLYGAQFQIRVYAYVNSD